jgi:hypothetical protein
LNIQSFIFNWHNQFESTLVIEKQLNKILDQVNVINSDENNSQSHWLNVGENCYFTDQLLKAIELHDGSSFFFHVQGDTSYNNWPQLVQDATYYINEYNAGIYYPRVLNTEWDDQQLSLIQEASSEHKNIKLISCGDETVWLIRPEIINYFKENNLQNCFLHNKYGWGWDVMFCAISYILKMPVIRDYNHVIKHDMHTNYDTTQAQFEYDLTKDLLPPHVAEFIEITSDPSQNNKILNYLNI